MPPKTQKKTQFPLKDFDIVAHAVPCSDVTINTSLLGAPVTLRVHAIYINRYGLDIGALLTYPDGTTVSWDYHIWQEYLEEISGILHAQTSKRPKPCPPKN